MELLRNATGTCDVRSAYLPKHRHSVPIPHDHQKLESRAKSLEVCAEERWPKKCSRRAIPPRGFLKQGSEIMLSRCANSQCSKPFLRLREGKLFLVETERVAKPGESTSPPFVRARKCQRLVEHYWLCDDCATRWTLMYSQERGIAIAPLTTADTRSRIEETSSRVGLRFG